VPLLRQAALDGELNPTQVEKLSLIRRHINGLDDLKTSLEHLIYKLAEKYQPQIDLLMAVPGISQPPYYSPPMAVSL